MSSYLWRALWPWSCLWRGVLLCLSRRISCWCYPSCSRGFRCYAIAFIFIDWVMHLLHGPLLSLFSPRQECSPDNSTRTLWYDSRRLFSFKLGDTPSCFAFETRSQIQSFSKKPTPQIQNLSIWISNWHPFREKSVIRVNMRTQLSYKLV